jgi:cytochrome c oxidase subunit 2
VLHSWGVPSLGIKLDTVPGRLNETWDEISREGVYYGFCSELCGVNHSYMPIAIEAVSEDDFNAWVEQAKEEFARVDDPAADSTVRVAQTAPVE